METVRDILQAKGDVVWTIPPDASVYEALKRMAEKGVGALLVAEGDRVEGIISERDCARKVELHGKTATHTPVSDIMTHDVLYVTPDTRVRDCMALMTERRVRHLPVMDGTRLAGLVSIGDVVKSVISEQEFVIEQLENYITGR